MTMFDVITGVEADYDATPIHGRVISFGEAIARVRDAGIATILYTSPSFYQDCRSIGSSAPLSAEYPPQDRDLYMARLNGLFDGAFASESWTLSQSYFFGAVNHNPSHRVEVIDGICIDRADHLDASAIGRPETQECRRRWPAPSSRQARAHHRQADPWLCRVAPGQCPQCSGRRQVLHLRDISFTLGGYLHLLGWTVDQTASTLVDALPDTVKDWTQARETARNAIEAARKSRSTLRSDRSRKLKTRGRPEPTDQPRAGITGATCRSHPDR